MLRSQGQPQEGEETYRTDYTSYVSKPPTPPSDAPMELENERSISVPLNQPGSHSERRSSLPVSEKPSTPTQASTQWDRDEKGVTGGLVTAPQPAWQPRQSLTTADWQGVADLQLEEKRRRAIREREREAAALQRNKELLARRREETLRHREQLEAETKEQEQKRLERERFAKDEVEHARLAKLQEKEEEEVRREEEKRRLAAVELRREVALQNLEAQRLRAAEKQRRHREEVLQKRQAAERVREETDRVYRQRQEEEAQRKADIIAAISRHREDKLAVVQARQQSALLTKQEEEMAQLLELQAMISALKGKVHSIQVQREETRHKLLEARHLVELLMIDEGDQTVALEEVESDVWKLTAHEKCLSRLVSSKYQEPEYERAVVTIQRYFRGARERTLLRDRRTFTSAQRREEAATAIQALARGRAVRRQRERAQRAQREAEGRAATTIGKVFRGMQGRQRAKFMRRDKEDLEIRVKAATTIQNFWRTVRAVKERNRLLEEREIEKRPQRLRLGQRKGKGRAGGRGAPPKGGGFDMRGPPRGPGGQQGRRGPPGGYERPGAVLGQAGGYGREQAAGQVPGHTPRPGYGDGYGAAPPPGYGGEELGRGRDASPPKGRKGDQGGRGRKGPKVAKRAVETADKSPPRLPQKTSSVSEAGGEMEWTTRDELRAAQRRDHLDAKLGGHHKAELSRIYLNPGGRAGQRQGPRSKRIFIPLPATTQAASALGLQGPGVMVQRDGERSGHLEGGVLITRHPPVDRPFVQRVNVDMSAMPPAPPPGGHPPAHARRQMPELIREQHSNYTPRTTGLVGAEHRMLSPQPEY